MPPALPQSLKTLHPQTIRGMDTSEIIGNRKQYLLKRAKKFYPVIVFLIILFLAAFIRTRNLPLLQDKYPGALDPYFFLREARTLISQGSIPEIDRLRYVPIGADNRIEAHMTSYAIAYIYKFTHFFDPSFTIEKSAILYPVIAFCLSLIPFFFLSKKLFNENIALISTFLLVISPAALQRSMAGFADKESLALIFFFSSFLFLLFYLDQGSFGKKSLFALLTGMSLLLLGLTWGGIQFVLLTIAVTMILLYLTDKLSLQDEVAYIFVILPLLLLPHFTLKYGSMLGMLTSVTMFPIFAIAGVFLADVIINNLPCIRKEQRPVVIFLLLGILGIVLLAVVSPARLLDIGQKIYAQFIHPIGTNRLTLTVAENRQPYFVEWLSSFGVSLYLFLAGGIILFYTLLHHLKAKMQLTACFIFLLLGLLWSRYQDSSILNGTNIPSLIFLFGSLGVFIGLLKALRDEALAADIKELNTSWLFLLAWLIVSIIGARGAIRLFFIIPPIASILIAYLIFYLFTHLPKKDKVYRGLAIGAILLVMIPTVLSQMNSSLQQAAYSGPGLDDQWQKAMAWVKTQTPENAVFAHWWDYGYWVQTSGNRSTILDGGNYYPYWNHLFARNVLVGNNEEQALRYLKVHNATHLLIISDEIGKYQAYSSIGADENFDIFSWIGTYVMDVRQTTKKGNITDYIFAGGTYLDEDFIFEGKVFPKSRAAIAGFIIPVANDDDPENMDILQPEAILLHNNQQVRIPISCVFDDRQKLYFNKTGMEGCLRIMPRYLNQKYQQENGAALWVTRKGMDALWTRMFLFDEQMKYFHLVYDDSNERELAYYGGQTMGPLKIWEISYPENLTIDKEMQDRFLSITTPEWLLLEKSSPLLT